MLSLVIYASNNTVIQLCLRLLLILNKYLQDLNFSGQSYWYFKYNHSPSASSENLKIISLYNLLANNSFQSVIWNTVLQSTYVRLRYFVFWGYKQSFSRFSFTIYGGSLWWSYPAGKLSSTITALILSLLKREQWENRT